MCVGSIVGTAVGCPVVKVCVVEVAVVVVDVAVVDVVLVGIIMEYTVDAVLASEEMFPAGYMKRNTRGLVEDHTLPKPVVLNGTCASPRRAARVTSTVLPIFTVLPEGDVPRKYARILAVPWMVVVKDTGRENIVSTGRMVGPSITSRTSLTIAGVVVEVMGTVVVLELVIVGISMWNTASTTRVLAWSFPTGKMYKKTRGADADRTLN